MTEKMKKLIFVLAFFAMLILPSLVWPLMQESLAGENTENRILAEKPEFSLEGIDEYPAAYEAYYNDRLPFRSQLIRWNSRLGYGLFGEVSGADAVVGKDGWMFYRSESDGDPMGDYMGRTLFYDNELEAIARNLTEARDALEAQGIEFVLMIAPNKERIYAEYMPDYYGQPAADYAAKQLVAYLEEHTNLRVVYAYDALQEAKEQLPQIPLYYKMDTHWNNMGGYVGARELLTELGVEMPALGQLSIEKQDVDTGYTDLVNMLSLQQEFPKEKEYLLTGYDRNNVVRDQWDFFGQYRFYSDAADERRVFVIRDSFCSAMAEVLGSQFAESVMVHNSAYQYELIEEMQPDVVVYQVVERFLGDLVYWRLGE